MAIKNATDQTIDKEINESNVVLVDFWAPWCGPCKQLSPILEDLDKEASQKLTIVKVNVDEEPETPSKYGIMGIPTMVVFKNGSPIDKMVGFHSKDKIKATLEKYI
jgi:thioredoxin 1